MQETLPLRDIHMPEAIGWWPPALGWWLLLLLVPLSCLLIAWIYKRVTRKTAVKSAKKLLTAIQHNNTLEDLHKLQQISALLRRVAITVSPRSNCAGLTGNAWLAYLDQSVNGAPFSQGAGRFLSDAHFRRSAPDDLNIAALCKLCQNWLKAQR